MKNKDSFQNLVLLSAFFVIMVSALFLKLGNQTTNKKNLLSYANEDFILASKPSLSARVLIPKGSTYQTESSSTLSGQDQVEGYHILITLPSGVKTAICWGCSPVIFPNDQICKDLADKYKSDDILGGCNITNEQIGKFNFEEFSSKEDPSHMLFAFWSSRAELYTVTIDTPKMNFLEENDKVVLGKIFDSITYSKSNQ